MRTAAFVIVFAACSCAANAQKFSLLPQVGFENSKTLINYNDAQSLFPLGTKFSPQGSLRLNYTSRQGHGFFVGVANSRQAVSFDVADPENALNTYVASAANMQLRLEGGYRFSTPKLNLGKSSSKQSSGRKTFSNSSGNTSYRCGELSRSSCYYRRTVMMPEKVKGPSWVRLQPSIGMAFIPNTRTDVITKTQAGQTSFEYRAGNWNTALITGADLEFGKKNTSVFTLSVNYINGMGNLGKQTISTVQANKTTTSILQSDVSGWNLRIGVPFSLGRSKGAKPQKVINTYTPQKRSCGQYRVMHRCGRSL